MKRKDITRFLIWELIIVVGVLAVIGGVIYFDAAGPTTETALEAPAAPTLAATSTPSPSPRPTARLMPTPTPSPQLPVAGLAPIQTAGTNTIGWAEADEPGGQLGESYLYMVLRGGTVYHGPLQFDVSFVPAGSTVFMTELLDGETGPDTTFVFNILPGAGHGQWAQNDVGAAYKSSAGGTLPAVVEAALASREQGEKFVFTAGQRAAVEARLAASQLETFSLNSLFPEGRFDIAGGAFLGKQEQMPTELPALPGDELKEEEATPTIMPTFVMVTSTPTPENILTVAAMAPTATYQATATGTPTPVPQNWVTPWIVTSTPTAENQATVQFRVAEATAAALVYGPEEPPAINMVTATPEPTETPTPVFILLDGELPPTTPVPAATPVPTPPIPAELIGKIAFKSDRTGTEEIYIINPDGTGLAILTDRWPYNVAELADTFSAEGRFRVFTKDMVRYKNISDVLTGETIGAKRDDAPALYWYDSLYQVEELLTHFGAGIAYEGVWSPTSEQIAFVSNDSGNDEIWVVNRDGADPRQLTRDEHNWWDKHPSWSPNGNQLVFWSNRTGHGQIWVMDEDGNNQYSLSRTGYNDWDPVWIKYPGLPGNGLDIHMPYVGLYDPAGADQNCNDFDSRAEAQTFYLAAGGPYRDPHKLDRDNDGIACN